MMRLNSLIIFFLFFIVSKYCSGQSYGLAFNGNEEVQDKRTSLDLSPNEFICIEKDFDLSFDLSFMPGHSNYFGYIFRIIEDNGHNIDLVYDRRFEENNHIKLIVGEELSNIAFDINLQSMLKNWHRIKLSFIKSKKMLVLTVDKKKYVQKVRFTPKRCMKILFGANNYKKFRTTDLPPMKIKNIKISDDKNLIHHWPLTELEGSTVRDIKGAQNAEVVNPLWIKKMHYQWELMKKFSVKGVASVAFDKKSENLYIISADSIFSYNVPMYELKHVAYQEKQFLMPGNQSFFNSVNNQLINFYIDQKLVSKFDFSKSTWDKNYIHPDVITNFWHYNKFYSSSDSSLYMIGGYGQFTYYKDLIRYHFPTQKWEVIKPNGNFTPRYLAALGSVKNGAYVLGGYGSLTGQQILNPKNLYDLSFYDIKKRTFNKILELENKGEEFAFANSLIVDEQKRSYYALTFNNHKFNTTLQLISGSLDKNTYQLVGSTFPYTFHDIHSFVDLYFCPQLEKFIAVTLFHDEEKDITSVEVYSLFSPPLTATENLGTKRAFVNKWYLLVLVIITVAIVLFLYYQKLKKQKKANILSSAKNLEEGNALFGIAALKEEGLLIRQTENEKQNVRNAIFLFGDMQLFDASGNDITKYFTPLLKELFLVILLHTIKGHGISSEKLTEILWFDKSQESARNNRSVNIAKLKTILEKITGCDISKKTGYWRIECDGIFVDYALYLRIVTNRDLLDKERVVQLSEIIQRGSFLSNVEYEWLDSFKSDVSNEVVDVYSQFMKSINILDNPEFLIKIANYISCFDPVNEEAMNIKCKALAFLGKHSLAKTTYENFKKEYKMIYQEEYSLDFQTILDE